MYDKNKDRKTFRKLGKYLLNDFINDISAMDNNK